MKTQTDIPLRLQCDNFTPLTRTPWAGDVIYSQYKSHLPDCKKQPQIGESWEVSCDPAFPSKISGFELTLQQIIDADPINTLGPANSINESTCEILVKLLNAASPLSLQIHPKDNDPDLRANECGKPESWYILDCDPGCGIYLGFNRKLSVEELRSKLLDGDQAKEVMQFVPVKSGDFFEIAPGVPHAIGPGVTLLEPQRILKGKSGKTYRLWDWGRLYDNNGVESSTGEPRQLHIDEGIKLIDLDRCHGEEFWRGLMKEPARSSLNTSLNIKSFPSNPYYQVHIIESPKPSTFTVKLDRTFGLLLTLQGQVEFTKSAEPKRGELLSAGKLPRTGDEFVRKFRVGFSSAHFR